MMSLGNLSFQKSVPSGMDEEGTVEMWKQVRESSGPCVKGADPCATPGLGCKDRATLSAMSHCFLVFLPDST